VAQCAQCASTLLPDAQFCASCGAHVIVRPAEAAGDPYLGRVFAGKYRVEALLGEGGMGRVYRATQLSLDKTVCLKVLREEVAKDVDTQARFQREARAASRLNHPNSIQVMDFGKTEHGELYLTMEFVKGRDLQQLLSREYPLAESRVVHIMGQVLDALEEAHLQHVIHRDLKPENIMVAEMRGDPDFVKVLDFGIAKIQDSASQTKLTRAGLVCGTPEYMSPEQARGLELDARSDVYSAGVILYQMVTGSLPFNSDTPVGYVTAHLTDIPEPPIKRQPSVSKELSDLVLKALSKDRDERPATARMMRDQLLALLPATRGSTEFPLPPELVATQYGPARPRANEQSFPFAAAALLLLALAGSAVAAYHFWPSSPTRKGQPLGQQPAGAAQGSHPALPSTAVPSPSPSDVAAEAVSANREGNQLYQQALAEEDAQKRNGYLREAIKAYYHAAQLSPGYAAPLRGLGMCYQTRGDPGDSDLAAAHYRKYLESVPTPLDAAAVRQQLAGLNGG
jgi:serine/threonine protein kinase